MQAIDTTDEFAAAVANQMDRFADLFATILRTRSVLARVAIIGADLHAIE